MKPFDHVNCADCPHRRHSVFNNTSLEVLQNLSEAKGCLFYRKGETIFHEGGHGFGVYCIHMGKIKLSISGEDGKEQIVRLVKSGDILGYRAVLSGGRYAATAVALEDCSVCFLPREDFFKALKKDGNLSFETMRQLSEQLGEAEIRLTHLAQKPVRERLAEALILLRETYGCNPESGQLAVQLSREDIANLVGTATETAIRLLSELNREGIIALVGKKINILNSKELTRVANLLP